MKSIVMTKSAGGALVPIDQQAIEYLTKLKLGAGVTVEIKRHRNPAFHRKFMALMNLAFEAWEQTEVSYKGVPVEKEFDKFRGDITVMAGFYRAVVNFRGEVQLLPLSISFSNMNQDDFEKLYSAVVNVVLAKVLTSYTRDDLDNVVNQILGFV